MKRRPAQAAVSLLFYTRAFHDAEKSLAEGVALLAGLEEPVEVGHPYEGDEPVYLLPRDGFPLGADTLKVYLVDESLDELLSFARYVERLPCLELVEEVLGNFHMILIYQY